VKSPTTAIRQALWQAGGYLRYCRPQGHRWTGPDPDRTPDLGPPEWKGVCVTCGKIGPPRPTWKRFGLMNLHPPQDAMRRLWLYATITPGLLGLTALAAIVLPGNGDDLTLTRVLIGCGAMIAVQFVGGYLGARTARR
jgi:hypothetical protein